MEVVDLGCVSQSPLDLKLPSKGSLRNPSKEKDVWHAYRVTGTTDTVVWMQWSLETSALSPLKQTGMLLYVTAS